MRDTNAAKDLLYRSADHDTGFVAQPFFYLTDDWGVWPTMKRPTRTLTWPELETKMLPLLKTSKYWNNKCDWNWTQRVWKMPVVILVLNYWPNFNQLRQHEVCTMFEGLSKTAQAELEMQKGRRVTHFQKSLHELAELEVCLWQLTCQLSSSSPIINLNFSFSRWNMPRPMLKCWGRQ